MKRIDLHIHTKKTDWDLDFNFDFDQLLKHVTGWDIDAIAITNHNTFDLPQYHEIRSKLSGKCVVFPGVEVSALDTHLLLICDPTMAGQLSGMCDALRSYLSSVEDSATLDELEKAFPLLEDFIVIPHYEKNPAISHESLNALGHRITACETSSLKKAVRFSKTKPVPYPFVYFTDYRFGSEDASGDRPAYKPGATYVRTESCGFSAIRRALREGECALTWDGSESLEICPGMTAAAGVNLILGKRSTGKTHTLERIAALCDEEDLYYIEQGDLVKASKEEEFYSSLDSKFASGCNRYRSVLQEIVSEAGKMGSDKKRSSAISTYLQKLRRHAETKTENDSFSSCTLFNRVGISEISCDEDHRLIEAITTILDASRYADALERTVGRNNLLAFLEIVVNATRDLEMEREAIKAANKATLAVQSKLNQSSVDPYPQPTLFGAFRSEAFFMEFSQLIEKTWTPTIVARDHGSHFAKYEIIAKRSKFANATEVKKALHLSHSTSLDGITRKSARDYINTLLEIDGVADITPGLFDIQIEIRDERGSKPSGGQRTECVFLGRLAEAAKKSVVLIDEPESSFDNPFLDEHIAAQIKKIADSSTVFVTTHNQVLGFGLKPNKVFITSYDEDAAAYKIHCGDLADAALRGDDPESEIPTVESIIEILEAGRDSYEDRQGYYEGKLS